jgi:hypothetical protein
LSSYRTSQHPIIIIIIITYLLTYMARVQPKHPAWEPAWLMGGIYTQVLPTQNKSQSQNYKLHVFSSGFIVHEAESLTKCRLGHNQTNSATKGYRSLGQLPYLSVAAQNAAQRRLLCASCAAVGCSVHNPDRPEPDG